MPASSMYSTNRGGRENHTDRQSSDSSLPAALRSSAFLSRPAEDAAGSRSISRERRLAGAAEGVEHLSAAQNCLLAEHLPLVRVMARGIHGRLPQHVELEDLVSAGMVGLLDAAHKFDVSKKVQFRSYAQFRIRGAILDSLRALDWSPRYLRRRARAVDEASRTLRARMGESPTEFEVARELQMELGEYQQLLRELKGLEIGTLNSGRLEDSGEDEIACIPARPEDDPLFRCLQGEVHQRMADAITELPERERLVMTLYYYEELTMREIGLALEVVESRVSQIHASALMRMRLLVGDMSTRRVRSEAESVRAGKSRRPGAQPVLHSPLPA